MQENVTRSADADRQARERQVGQMIKQELGERMARQIAFTLEVPEGWVDYSGEKQRGPYETPGLLTVLLAVKLEDTGDGESGPCLSMTQERWVEITKDELEWVVTLFDDTGVTEPYGPEAYVRYATAQARIYGDMPWDKVVAWLANKIRQDAAWRLERS